MKLEELRVYQSSMKLAEDVWDIVIKWDYFAKDTIGKQLIRSADSVAANLSEGFGRFFYKEERQFCYYSRGSLFETMIWLKKAHLRKLVKDSDYNYLASELKNLSVKLNNYIKTLGTKSEQKTIV